MMKKKMAFPVISEFDMSLPYYSVGVGCNYEQEKQDRPNGFPNYQWIQCRRGTGRLHLDGTEYTVSENQGMLLFPNISHEYYSLSSTWEVDWIIFDGLFINEFFMKTARNRKSGVYFISHPHTISDKISQIYEIETSDSPIKSFESSRLTYEILIDILQYSSEKIDSSIANRYGKLNPVFRYIEENYPSPIPLNELSDLVGITPQYLCNTFKKLTSYTITEYINEVRIKKSKELLLQNKKMQIKDIALSVGFNDVSYFCSIFRKVEQMSPLEFKLLL